MTLDAERATWSGRQGDDWHQSWTLAATDRTYDGSTLLIQLRNTATGAVIAANETNPEGVLDIDQTGTDLSSPPLTFAWTIRDTDSIPVGTDYVIEAQCEIDGYVTTFFSHQWEVVTQWAVAQA